MNDVVMRLAKVLGAQGVEQVGNDARFLVDGGDGSRLKVSVDMKQQRVMAVLTDTKGVVRADLDVAPVHKVEEVPAFPGRVKMLIGTLVVQIDVKPTLAIEVLSAA
jgi:hypothetical protein